MWASLVFVCGILIGVDACNHVKYLSSIINSIKNLYKKKEGENTCLD